ncbi:MAG: hypothetical protein ABR562_08335, partial [Thermoplasmatota archaeon]
MRDARGLVLAILALTVFVVAGLPAVQAPGANRAPHPVVGPNQVVGDSATTCNPPADTTGCRRINFNFNQSWDPDPLDLLNNVPDGTAPDSYCFIAQPAPPTMPGPCTAAPSAWTTVPNTPMCDPIAPVATSSSAPFEPVVDAQGNWAGQFYTYAPIMTDPHIPQCVISFKVTVDDGHAPDPAPAVPPNFCCAVAPMTITVLDGNEPPLFDCDSFGVCAATALQFQTNEMASYGTDGSVDLYTDRGTDIDFQALATTDDRETKSMDLYLDIGDADLLEHRIHVTMHKCGEWPRSAPPSQPRSTDPDCPANIAGDQDCCGTVGAPEIASWRGSLPVNTPELIEGDYHVWARLFDTRNVNTTTPDIFDMVTLHVTSLEDTCVPACIKLNSLQPASNIPGNCFYNEADATRNVLPAPRDRLSLQQLGELSKIKRDFAGAREAFERILQIDPEDASSHYNLMLI